MTPLAEALILLTAKYGPVLVSQLIDVAQKPKPTRAEWDGLWKDVEGLDYDKSIRDAEKRAAGQA